MSINTPKNYIRNPSGHDGFTGWKILSSSGDEWVIEKKPGGCDELPAPDKLYFNSKDETCFVTSYGPCSKSYLVDFKSEGLSGSAMALLLPLEIVCSQMYASRWDCGGKGSWHLAVLDENKKVLQEHEGKMEENHVGWKYIEHAFEFGTNDQNLVKRIRYLEFTHEGQDLKFWAGHYGMKFARACVKITASKTPAASSLSSLFSKLLTKPNATSTDSLLSKKRIDPAALTFLMKLPGASAAALQECLFVARLLTPKDEMHQHILTYVTNGLVHGYGIKVTHVVRLVRDNDLEFEHDPEMKNQFRLLLWHGTKENAVAGILQTGFKIPDAKNQMFGTGIYFADRSSKSANYCLPSLKHKPKKGDTAYMFLCDVAVGKWYNSKNPKNTVTSAPMITTSTGASRPCDSVKCTGANIPDESEKVKVRGCVIPLGKTVKNTKFDSYSVQYNEFIVYDSSRVKIKYLVKIEFE